MDQPIEQRIKSFEAELMPLLDKYGLKMTALMEFPIYRILPDEVQLAIAVLSKHSIQYRISYVEKDKK